MYQLALESVQVMLDLTGWMELDVVQTDDFLAGSAEDLLGFLL